MAAGAGGDPAAEGRELEALRKMPKRQARWLEPSFELRSQRAGLNTGGAAGFVNLQHLVHAPHVDRDRSSEAIANPWLDATDDCRPTSEGNDGGICVSRPVEQVNDICGRLGKCNGVGRR